MAIKRRKPRVYLDASCIGRILDRDGDAQQSLLALLAQFEYDQLVFIESAWLRRELRQIKPRTARMKVSKIVPKGDWVQWDSALGREADEWVLRLGLMDDDSGLADCRHLACAIRGEADVLVTHDGRFYEALRQHAKLIKPLRPAPLVGWQEIVYGS